MFGESWKLLLATLASFLGPLFIRFVHGDEGGWLHLSRSLMTGELYQTLTDTKPPLLLLYYWGLSGGGESMLWLRIATIIWIWLGAVALKCLCQRFLSKRESFAIAMVFCLSIGLIENGAVSCERIYLPLVIWACALTLAKPPTASRSALAGLCVGCAFLVKQPAVVLGVISMLPFFGNSVLRLVGLSAAWLVGFGLSLVVTIVILPQSLSDVWNESFVQNFTYISSHAVNRAADIRQNFLAFVFWYAPLLLASLVWLKNLRGPLRSWWLDKRVLWTMAAVALSLLTLSIGSRFYQTYYLNLLPLLSIATGLTISRSPWPGRWWTAIGLWCLMGLSFTALKQIQNKNWAWDSHVQQLVSDIETMTGVEDKIWILNAVQPAYAASHRRAAVKHVYFHQTLGHIDLCLADESLLRERLDLPNYQRLMTDLQTVRPRLIFWTQRAKNTCSHRLKKENFPTLQSFIDSNYELVKTSELGRLYILKQATSPKE